jgi:hypothetical protein
MLSAAPGHPRPAGNTAPLRGSAWAPYSFRRSCHLAPGGSGQARRLSTGFRSVDEQEAHRWLS